MGGTGDSEAGAALYTPFVLRFYDPVVHGFNLPVLWRCRSARVQRLYDDLASANHLDVGVGTGHYLDRCRFRTRPRRIVLMDLNPNSLAHTSRRIARYAPETRRADVLEPLAPAPAPFDSIAIATLLHCVPGAMADKAPRVLDNLLAVMNPGAVLFGSTVLGAGVAIPRASGVVMRMLNRRGVFSNAEDDAPALHAALEARLVDVRVEVIGLMALFSGRKA